MTAARFTLLILGLAAGLAGPALAQEGPALAQEGKEPYELIRTLRSVHDQVVLGSRTAHSFQRTLLAHIAREISVADRSVWQEPRNGRAIIVYALSGGDPRALRNLLAQGSLAGIEDNLAKGALAYSEGRNTEALELLTAINARSLDPSIAGHVALVQSILMTRKDRTRAIALLDDARLLAPGTLVEEAALRREILLVAATGDFPRFEALASQYLRRFPKSVYAWNFHSQFAMHLTRQKQVDDPDQLARLEVALENIPPEERRDVYLTIARESISLGKIGIARFAATKAGALTAEDGIERARSNVYAGAALIVTDEFDRGYAALKAIEAAVLAQDDAELLESALEVAQKVRRMPEPAGPPPVKKATGSDRSAQLLESEVVKQAQVAMAQVDQFLKGVAK